MYNCYDHNWSSPVLLCPTCFPSFPSHLTVSSGTGLIIDRPPVFYHTKEVDTILNFCAGIISTMDQFKDKHPEEVKEWILCSIE